MASPRAISLLLVLLCLSTTLPAPAVTSEVGNTAQDVLYCTTSRMTAVDNECSPLVQRRQDLLDTRFTELHTQLNGLNTRLNSRQVEVNRHLDRINDHLNSRQVEVHAHLERINTRLNSRQEEVNVHLDKVDTHYSTTQLNHVNSRLNSIDRRLHRIEKAIVDMKNSRQPTVTQKPQVYRDCADALRHGHNTSGVYIMNPDRGYSFNAYCEQRLDGGGWTVFQARKNGSFSFYHGWETYKAGFGVLTAEFWLGNNKIHRLTKQQDQQLKIQLTSPDGEVAFADYSHFWIDDEAAKFRLNISGYSGADPPGDSMAYSNGHQFSTLDKDHDGLKGGSCARSRHGAWWYDYCALSNLNGRYKGKSDTGMHWYKWDNTDRSMKATRMMIRRRT